MVSGGGYLGAPAFLRNGAGRQPLMALVPNVRRSWSSGAGGQALVVSGRGAPRSTGSSAIRAAAIRRSSAAACLRPLTVCRRCSHRNAGGGLSRSSAAACLRLRPLTGATAMQAAEPPLCRRWPEPLLGRRLPVGPSPRPCAIQTRRQAPVEPLSSAAPAACRAAACLRLRPLTGATAMQAVEPLLGRRLPASPSPRPSPAFQDQRSTSPTRRLGRAAKRTGKTRANGVMTRNTRTLTRNLAAEDSEDTGADTGDTFGV
jgi:hypothetical protein